MNQRECLSDDLVTLNKPRVDPLPSPETTIPED